MNMPAHIPSPRFRSPSISALIILLMVAAACTTEVASTSDSQAPVDPETLPESRDKPLDLDCPELLPGAETVEVDGRLIAIGEFHGTREAPEVTAALLCHAATLESALVLGVELTADDQELFDRFLATDDDVEARAIFLTSNQFDREYQDGRTSIAMFNLLLEARRLHKLRSEVGRETAILAFDFNLPQPDREIEMTKIVREARQQAPDATMILLTGNLHAAKRRGNPFNPEFLSMAYRLIEPAGVAEADDLAPIDLTSLMVEVASGEAWYCNDPDPARCGPKPTGNRNHGETAFLKMDSELAGEGFDGLIYLPTSTASPPAIAAD